MKQVISTTALLLALLFPHARINASADPAFISQSHVAFENALVRSQFNSLSPYYRSDTRLMPPFQRTIKGEANAIMYYRKLLGRLTFASLKFNARKITSIDTVLIEHGTYTWEVTVKAGGQRHVLTGNYLHLWSVSDGAHPSIITAAWNIRNMPFDQHTVRFPEIPAVDVALMPHLPVNNDLRFELASLNRMMEATVTQHDAAAWDLFYADDATLLANGDDYFEGRTAIRKYIVEHCASLPIFEKLDIRNDEVVTIGDQYVIEYASHVACWRYDEHSGVGLGKDFRIWRRQPGGPLKMITHIGSYD